MGGSPPQSLRLGVFLLTAAVRLSTSVLPRSKQRSRGFPHRPAVTGAEAEGRGESPPNDPHRCDVGGTEQARKTVTRRTLRPEFEQCTPGPHPKTGCSEFVRPMFTVPIPRGDWLA